MGFVSSLMRGLIEKKMNYNTVKRNYRLIKDTVNKAGRLTESSTQLEETGLDGGKVGDWQGRGGNDLSRTKRITVEGKIHEPRN
jgi:hypothetical protein